MNSDNSLVRFPNLYQKKLGINSGESFNKIYKNPSPQRIVKKQYMLNHQHSTAKIDQFTLKHQAATPKKVDYKKGKNLFPDIHNHEKAGNTLENMIKTKAEYEAYQKAY